MSNIHDNETLEMIHEDVLADDEKGFLAKLPNRKFQKCIVFFST